MLVAQMKTVKIGVYFVHISFLICYTFKKTLKISAEF